MRTTVGRSEPTTFKNIDTEKVRTTVGLRESATSGAPRVYIQPTAPAPVPAVLNYQIIVGLCVVAICLIITSFLLGYWYKEYVGCHRSVYIVNQRTDEEIPLEVFIKREGICK